MEEQDKLELFSPDLVELLEESERKDSDGTGRKETPGEPDVKMQPEEPAGEPDVKKRPTVVVLIGMAGSGKTTLMRGLYLHFNCDRVRENSSTEMGERTVEISPRKRTYIMNLDPAVRKTPYPINIDIRDSIKYQKVMKQYQLGPNGAILTSLNLFATRFDQALRFLEAKEKLVDYILIDTPGQIEVFNWSASGSIILESLAVRYPTVVVYIVDTPRCINPISFMSNMLYACGVLYKSKLPFLMAFNKTDVCDSAKCRDWMKNFDSYANAINCEDTYMASLSKSCGLVINSFYKSIKAVSISAATLSGLDELEKALEDTRKEYFDSYVPWVEEQRAAVKKRREDQLEASLEENIRSLKKHESPK